MTANQRRPGFRLPWTSEEEREAARAGDAIPEAPASPEPAARVSEPEGAAATPSADAQPTATGPEPAPAPSSAVDADPPQEFMRELVAAMRRVADETRQAGLADAMARADARVKQLETDGERRRGELSIRAESDIAAVGEWAMAEAERIKAEAERRVAARRTQLDEQLSADRARGEADAKAVRDRIGEFERELDAYHAQLAEISDPAAFAAAAKRMPRPPMLEDATATHAAPAPAVAAEPEPSPTPAAPSADAPTPVETGDEAAPAASTNGQQPDMPEVHPAEEEVLAIRLAELDATLAADAVPAGSAAPAAAAAPDSTEVVVSGLGSFGAITSFRQALADVDGVEGVALSLGGSGEFVFRASHRPGFDIGAAITSLEGDAARVQPRPEGGLLVKLERRR